MIVCTKCAFQNLDDDAFCGSCGAFLEWSGEAVVPEAREDAVEQVAEKRSLRARVQTILALDVHAPGENEGAPDDAGGAAAPAGPGGPGAPPSRPGAPPSRPGAPPSRPGAPPSRPGAPPSRPGAPPSRPGAPPSRPGGGPGGPPARPGGGPTPPARPGGPPARPGEAPTRPGSPPSRPGEVPVRPGGPPTRPGGAPSAPEVDPGLLVATGATTSAPPAEPAPPPRVIAKKETASGERVIGDVGDAGSEAVSPGAVDAVKPQPPADRPKPAKQKPTRKILAGDLICGECGEGNPPARKFCSRCGTPLATAQVAKPPWWRKLVPRRRRKAMDVGARPWKASDGTKKKRAGLGGFFAGAFRTLRPIVAVAVLAAGLLLGFSPDLRERATSTLGDAKESVMSRIQKTYGPIAPIDVTTNSELPDAPVSLAVDSNTITSWIAPGAGPEPVMVVRFDEPIDLEKVKVWNGSAVGFKDHARVRNFHFVFDTGQSFDLEVDDLPDGQDYSIDNGSDVREVEVHIVGTHSSLTSTDVGLSEIEFLVRR